MPVVLAVGAPACQLWFRRVWRGAGLVASAEEFVEFAEVMFPRLRRTAFMLASDTVTGIPRRTWRRRRW